VLMLEWVHCTLLVLMQWCGLYPVTIQVIVVISWKFLSDPLIAQTADGKCCWETRSLNEIYMPQHNVCHLL